jgi:glucosyl-dolichyl phosphate glucuronosyltransferase
MSNILLSIVVCTHDRAKDAMECISALHRQFNYLESEIFLVDSASSDAEREYLKTEMASFPGITYIRLDQPGLSIARNAGIAASRGEWIAFVDDDAVPEPDWYDQLISLLRRAPEKWGAIGGRILPIFSSGDPPKMGPRWKVYVSINDKTGSRDCTDRFELIAANSCFRRTALLSVGGFPTSLGRFKGSLLSGEDVLVMRQLRDAGWAIWFDSSFCVGHKVPRERLTRRWVHNRAYWEGITTIRMAGLLHDQSRYGLFVKAIMAIPVLWVLSVLKSSNGEWDLRFWFDWGVVIESLRLGPSR